MKKIMIAAVILITACQYQSKDDLSREDRQVKALQQEALAVLLAAMDIDGPHALLSVQYFHDSVHRYANMYFRNTQTGLEKNIIVEEPAPSELLGKTYVCMGNNCLCLVNAVLEPDGSWGAKCTCTECLLVIFSLEVPEGLFD